MTWSKVGLDRLISSQEGHDTTYSCFIHSTMWLVSRLGVRTSSMEVYTSTWRKCSGRNYSSSTQPQRQTETKHNTTNWTLRFPRAQLLHTALLACNHNIFNTKSKHVLLMGVRREPGASNSGLGQPEKRLTRGVFVKNYFLSPATHNNLLLCNHRKMFHFFSRTGQESINKSRM